MGVIRYNNKPQVVDLLGVVGAEGGTRTPTLSLMADFESAASTDSATSAGWPLIIEEI
jgi:hypothetical protein